MQFNHLSALGDASGYFLSGTTVRRNMVRNIGKKVQCPPQRTMLSPPPTDTLLTKLPQIEPTYRHVMLSPIATQTLESVVDELFCRDTLVQPFGQRHLRSVGKPSLKKQVEEKLRKLEISITQAESSIQSLIAMTMNNNKGDRPSSSGRNYILDTLVPQMRKSIAISRRALVNHNNDEGTTASCEQLRRRNTRLDAASRSMICVFSTILDAMVGRMG